MPRMSRDRGSVHTPEEGGLPLQLPRLSGPLEWVNK